MLKELQIRNFALIEELELSFYSGFSVLTGETGAGKSIIIDALGLLLGTRASTEVIRTGAESTTISASFTPNEAARSLVDAWGMDAEEDLIIAREINHSGRNKCWINGRLATVSQLAELGQHLVDIVGQHDSQSLLDPQVHGTLLDAYGGPEHQRLVAKVHSLADKWHELQSERRRLDRNERERNRRIDLLMFQVEEITNANLTPGEEQQLAVDRARLANLDRIRENLQFAVASLGETFNEQESILRRLSLVEAQLERATALDASLQPTFQRYTEIGINLTDVQVELRDYLEQLPADPRLLHEIEERLHLIENLQRKYGETVEEIIAYCADAEQELEDLRNAAVRVDDLERESEQLKEKWLEQALNLTTARRRLALDLEKRIEQELADLSMENTRFKVYFSPNDDQTPAVTGLEDIEFMLSANIGEELKPLNKIASGGELSRVMLAIKAILAKAEQIPTLIFDEIDAGIGGRTAVNLGDKLFKLSSDRQVLCVTHLPVIASCGSNHYTVQKSTTGDRTTVAVARLDENERVQELTRMLGGAAEQLSVRQHAEELLRKARSNHACSGS